LPARGDHRETTETRPDGEARTLTDIAPGFRISAARRAWTASRKCEDRHEARFAGTEIPSKSACAARRSDGKTGAAVNSSVVLWTVTPVGDV